MASVTLSSVGTSPPINLSWLSAKPVSALVTLATTTMSVDFTVQYTLDDFQSVTSTAVNWIGVGSSIGSSITHFSSLNADAAVTIGFGYPIAGLRLSSTALTSSSLTLKAIQGQGW
jgi:hypothetical protein